MKKEFIYIGGILISLGAIYYIFKQYKKNKDGSAALEDKEIIALFKKIDSAKKWAQKKDWNMGFLPWQGLQ